MTGKGERSQLTDGAKAEETVRITVGAGVWLYWIRPKSNKNYTKFVYLVDTIDLLAVVVVAVFADTEDSFSICCNCSHRNTRSLYTVRLLLNNLFYGFCVD